MRLLRILIERFGLVDDIKADVRKEIAEQLAKGRRGFDMEAGHRETSCVASDTIEQIAAQLIKSDTLDLPAIWEEVQSLQTKRWSKKQSDKRYKRTQKTPTD